MAKRGKVAIEITDREFEAVIAAWAYFAEQYQGEAYPADFGRDQAALSRIKAKWYAAKDLKERQSHGPNSGPHRRQAAIELLQRNP